MPDRPSYHSIHWMADNSMDRDDLYQEVALVRMLNPRASVKEVASRMNEASVFRREFPIKGCSYHRRLYRKNVTLPDWSPCLASSKTDPARICEVREGVDLIIEAVHSLAWRKDSTTHIIVLELVKHHLDAAEYDVADRVREVLGLKNRRTAVACIRLARMALVRALEKRGYPCEGLLRLRKA